MVSTTYILSYLLPTGICFFEGLCKNTHYPIFSGMPGSAKRLLLFPGQEERN